MNRGMENQRIIDEQISAANEQNLAEIYAQLDVDNEGDSFSSWMNWYEHQGEER